MDSCPRNRIAESRRVTQESEVTSQETEAIEKTTECLVLWEEKHWKLLLCDLGWGQISRDPGSCKTLPESFQKWGSAAATVPQYPGQRSSLGNHWAGGGGCNEPSTPLPFSNCSSSPSSSYKSVRYPRPMFYSTLLIKSFYCIIELLWRLFWRDFF